jgi:hypothetical protein
MYTFLFTPQIFNPTYNYFWQFEKRKFVFAESLNASSLSFAFFGLSFWLVSFELWGIVSFCSFVVVTLKAFHVAGTCLV